MIIGDSGYPPGDCLLTPVKESHVLRHAEVIFNYKQSATRMPVEMAFGLLKGKWSVLTSMKCAQVSLKQRCADVVAGCCLHNMEIDIGKIDVPDDEALYNPVFDGLTIRNEVNPELPFEFVAANTSAVNVQAAMVRTYGSQL